MLLSVIVQIILFSSPSLPTHVKYLLVMMRCTHCPALQMMSSGLLQISSHLALLANPTTHNPLLKQKLTVHSMIASGEQKGEVDAGWKTLGADVDSSIWKYSCHFNSQMELSELSDLGGRESAIGIFLAIGWDCLLLRHVLLLLLLSSRCFSCCWLMLMVLQYKGRTWNFLF